MKNYCNDAKLKVIEEISHFFRAQIYDLLVFDEL